MKRKLLSHATAGESDEALMLSCFSLFMTQKRSEPRLLVVESEALRNVMAHQDDLGYIKYIRLDRSLFHELLSRVSPIFEGRLLRVQGVPDRAKKPRINRRVLSTGEALFLTLRYLAGSGNVTDLSVTAGISHASYVRITRAMLVSLLVTLRHWSQGRISAPTEREAEALCQRISARLPRLRAFIGFADGMLCLV